MMVRGRVKRAWKWQRSWVETLCWEEQKQSELFGETTVDF